MRTYCTCGRSWAELGGGVIQYVCCDNCPKERWWFKALVAVDEWGHRHLPLLAHRWTMGLLCDWLDTRWLGESFMSVRASKLRMSWRLLNNKPDSRNDD